MPNQLYPILFMLSSTFSLSISGLLSKSLANQLDANLLGFLRFLLPALMILLMLCVRGVKKPSREMFKPIWVRAFCIAACQLCFIFSLQHLTLVESVVLFGTGPLFIPVLERLFFALPIKWVTVCCLVVTFSGVVMLSGGIGNIEFRPELFVGLAAGLFNAGSQISLYRVSKSKLNALEINFWTFIYASALLFPVMVISLYIGGISASLGAPESSSGVVLLVVMLATLSLLIINTQVFRSKAYKLVSSSSQLAPLIFTNLLFTALWQWLFFNDPFTAHQLFGLALIIAANVLNMVIPQWPAIRRMFEHYQHRESH